MAGSFVRVGVVCRGGVLAAYRPPIWNIGVDDCQMTGPMLGGFFVWNSCSSMVELC